MSVNGERIRLAFEAWEQGNNKPFFDLVSDQVDWTVIGSTPISGHYQGKREFLKATAPFANRLAGPITARIVDVNATDDKVFLQWEGSTTGTTGRPYRQSYCWVIDIIDGQVAKVVAYLDTEMVNAMFAD